MRESGVEVAIYLSGRDRDGGKNVVLTDLQLVRARAAEHVLLDDFGVRIDDPVLADAVLGIVLELQACLASS